MLTSFAYQIESLGAEHRIRMRRLKISQHRTADKATNEYWRQNTLKQVSRISLKGIITVIFYVISSDQEHSIFV